MKVGWLIDAEMFEAYRDDLVTCIREQGHDVKLIQAPSPPYRWDDAGGPYRGTFPRDACVVAHGDIELVSRIHRDGYWTPGAFAAVANFYCSSYYCWFGEYLLNRQYTMLPFGKLSRCRDFLFDTFGHNGSLFVRPDSPLKLFTGQVATRDKFDADLEYMAFYEFPPNSIVVVSSPQEIEAEWRFVVAQRQVVAGTQYKSGGGLESQPTYDNEALTLASKIAASEFQPDPVWVMDICRTTDGAYHLLEIGGFSFADLYACDKKAVVAAVSKAAIAEWKRSRG